MSEHQDASTDTGGTDAVSGANDSGGEEGPSVDVNVNKGDPIEPEPQDEQG